MRSSDATLAVFVPGADHELHTASVARVRAGGRYGTEIQLSRKDGSVWLAAVAVAPVLRDDGELAGAVASILDVTEERRASEALHAGQLAVLGRQRDLERERTALVQTLSHELRTPLTVVLGAAQTLQRDAVPDVARARLTRSLERGTDDLLRHLDAVLAATEGLAGEVVATTGRAIVTMALERLGSRHDLDRVTIDGDASWTGPATEAAGLLRPLLHNALKFSPAGARVEVTIAIADGEIPAGGLPAMGATGPGHPVWEPLRGHRGGRPWARDAAGHHRRPVPPGGQQRDAPTRRSRAGPALGTEVRRPLGREVGDQYRPRWHAGTRGAPARCRRSATARGGWWCRWPVERRRSRVRRRERSPR